MVSSQHFAVVAGIGPATGRSLALKFAEHYPVVLLSRRPESYTDVVTQINKSGGQAIGISADVTDEASLSAALASIHKNKAFESLQLVAAIYNVRPNLRPSRRPFLDLTLEDLNTSLTGNVYVVQIIESDLLSMLSGIL
jgi:NAD(P)-dependent dehydrogenase (short-subunit alcohol dehydrogenase family)